MQTNSVSRDVIAHHEAGHAVAGLVLGVPFTEVRIVPGEDGKIGVPLKTNPWTGPRPASNLANLRTKSGRSCREATTSGKRGRREIPTATPFSAWQGRPRNWSMREKRARKMPRRTTLLLPIGFPIASGASVNWSRRHEPWSESIGRRCRPSLRSFSIDRSYLRPRPRRSSSGPGQRGSRKVMGDSNGSACREGRRLRLVKLVVSRIVSTESEPRPLRGWFASFRSMA